MLIRPYDRQLRALAYRLLDDRAAMDDALQDAYVKAFLSLRDFAGTAAFGTWLYRIVYNTCLDELRRRGREPMLADDDRLERVEDVRDDFGEVETATDLGRALAVLPPELRAAVLLIDADGLSYDEASSVLGVPIGTVASRVNRARARLRPALANGGPA